jgi:two-component system sensor histidine kinase ChiS
MEGIMRGNAYVMPYLALFQTLAAGGTGAETGHGAAAAPVFLLGMGAFAAGLLFVAGTSLYFLLTFREEIPSLERNLRIGSLVSLLMIIGGLVFPLACAGMNAAVAAGSAVLFTGFLAFEVCSVLTLLSRRFPARDAKRLPLLVLPALAAALLPLTGLGASLVLGWFSLALLVLCLVLPALSLKDGRPWKMFFSGALTCLFLVPAFLLPPSWGVSFCAAALAVRLFLEYGFFTENASARAGAVRTGADASLSADLAAAEAPAETLINAEDVPGVQEDSIDPFIPREFLSILNKESIEELKVGDHIEQEMTIFFSDIRQFTDLSEKLTPEENFAFINSYLSRIVPEITRNGGFVDKFIGDAILALFPQKDGADMAVRTAIAIQEKVQEYNTHRAKCNYRPLAMGIGLHTGILMVGVVGTEDRMQNTVVSDAVNLASRLESITKVFGVSLAISEETFKKLSNPGSYKFRFIGKVRVKGKSAPVSVFEIFDGINPVMQERKIKANMFFEQGMVHYYQKNYAEALMSFRKVREILPDDGASAFYMDNCLSRIKAL